MNEEKLKPVVVMRGWSGKKGYDKFTQNILLNAISKGVTDPKSLKNLAGLRSVTQVYKTLDKMSIRKEYHEALYNAGVDMPFIVDGLKKLCSNAKSDSVRLRGFEIFLKSLGVDDYDKSETGGTAWEDTLLKTIEKNNEESRLQRLVSGNSSMLTPEILNKQSTEIKNKLYEVNVPKTPTKAARQRTHEQLVGESIYETK